MTDTRAPESSFASDASDEPEHTRRRRRKKSKAGRALLAVGVVLILIGVGILAWVGWQFWGTNWLSQQRQGEVSSSLEESWADGQGGVRTDWGRATALVRIPRFGDDYEVPVLEGSTDEVLAAGIGHMEETAGPGEPGNYAIAAHRVTNGEPFADFPKLRVGDEVIVETREAIHTYVLDTGGEDLIVDFTASWVLDPRPKNPDGGTQPPDDVEPELITLLTCSEIFHTDNRSVAFGHLVDTDEKTG